MWLTHRKIATLLGVPERVVKGALDGEPQEQVFGTMAKKARRELTAKHIEFLRNQSVLAEWRTLSLDARRVAFQQYFPGKLLSRHKLRAVYRKCGVLKRVLKDEIYLTAKQLERQTQGRDFAFPHILEELNAGRPVYYCDESVFSSR